MNNWVKLSRDLRGSFDKNPMKDFKLMSVYQYLLEKANWEDADLLKRGQTRISMDKISAAVPFMTRQHVDTALDGLVRLGRLSIEKTSGTKMFGRVATILDYGMQDDDISTYDLKKPNESRMKAESLALESLNKMPVEDNESRMKAESNTKELKKERKKTTSLSLAVAEDLSWIDIATEWNIRLPNHSQVRIPILRKNDKRKSDIRKAIEKHTSEIILEAINKIYSSEFLCGKNDRHWKPDLDWIIKTENIQKVLEGKYEDKNKPIPKERYLE